jgi:hypothetical protein
VEEEGLYGGRSSISSGSIRMGCDDDIVRALLLRRVAVRDTNVRKDTPASKAGYSKTDRERDCSRDHGSARPKIEL